MGTISVSMLEKLVFETWTLLLCVNNFIKHTARGNGNDEPFSVWGNPWCQCKSQRKAVFLNSLTNFLTGTLVYFWDRLHSLDPSPAGGSWTQNLSPLPGHLPPHCPEARHLTPYLYWCSATSRRRLMAEQLPGVEETVQWMKM